MDRQHIRTDAPPSGRRDTLLTALERLHDATGGAAVHIVEVGAARNLSERAMLTDGWATRVFAWYAAQVGGRLTTIDPRRRALERAATLVEPWAEHVEFVPGRAEGVVGRFEAIDLLYMDGPSDAGVHGAIWRALICRPTLVLWDDIVTPGDPTPGMPEGEKHFPPPGEHPKWAIKGAEAIPAMLTDGYTVVFERDRQVLLEAL